MYKILIADDEPIERIMITKKIQKFFPGLFEIYQAENGRKAIEIFKNNKCRIAILDIEMPGINGLEAAEKIHQYDEGSSIIFLTAFDQFSYTRRAIQVRALDYLLKPGNDEELISVLEEAMVIEDGKAGKNYAVESEKENEEAQQHQFIFNEGDSLRLNLVHEAIQNYIDDHYTENISLQDAARAMNYADAYFCKLFRQCYDMNFTTYLSEYRIKKAKELLKDITVNVKDIGSRVGYSNSNYFARVFKRIEGITPSEYRMKALGECYE